MFKIMCALITFSNNQNYYKACQSAQFYGIFALFIFNSYIKKIQSLISIFKTEIDALMFKYYY